jgi:lysophospholipase L1-like esterase
MKNQNNTKGSIHKMAPVRSSQAFSDHELITAKTGEKKTDKIQLMKDNIILFQGDSITDSERDKADQGYNTSKILGTGYAMLAAARLIEKYASLNLKIYNRGINGEKVFQLADRWDKDCLNIKPDILSILIGVNDFGHKLNGSYNGTIEIYKSDFRALLERTMKTLPNVRLIIGEPFGVPGIKFVDERWYPAFYDYQQAAKDIAFSFGAAFIPYQRIFDQAQKQRPGVYWTEDGVHPTLAGAQLMAQAWLETVK